MLRRTRIIWNCILISLAVFFVGWMVWRKSFRLTTLVEGPMAYEPVFYFSSDTGPAYRERARRLTEGRLEKVEYQSSWLYYSDRAAQLLKDKGYDDKGRAPLNYFQNEWGRVYVFDTQAGYFDILLLERDDGPLKKFLLPQQKELESTRSGGMDQDAIYLWRSTGPDRVDFVRISRADGEIQIRSMDYSLIRPADQWLYDPVRNRVLFLNNTESEKTLNCYSLDTGKLKTLLLTKPASWILIGDQGYLLVNDFSTRRIVFYPYDWQLNPMEEILIPLSDQGSRLGSWVRQHGNRAMALEDGIVYGGMEGEKAVWYYALDLQARRTVGLWEVRAPAGKLRLNGYRLFRKEEGS